ncbi:unnamed protein product [Chrysoparadoxa australica]
MENKTNGASKASKFGGFSLGKSKPKKPKLVAQVLGEQQQEAEPGKDFIKAVGEGGVESEQAKEKKGPLVIPLSVNPWQRKEAKKAAETPKEPETVVKKEATGEGDGEAQPSLDELAAQAIMQEVSQGKDLGLGKKLGMGMDSTRVIEMSGTKAEKDPKAGGILVGGMVPGIQEVQGEDAKFHHDVSMRADDIDVHSAAYRAVPIHEFGAALLRGMGWSGPEEGKGEGPRMFEPRHHRLGLGAQPKAPEDGKKRKRRPGEKAGGKSEDARAAWEAKAEKERSRLTVADVVALKGGKFDGRRAMVLRTNGVPGSNMVRVRMEKGGQEEDVERSCCYGVGEEELARRPFTVTHGDEAERVPSKRSRSSSGGRSDSERRRSKKAKQRKRDRSRSRDRDREKEARKKEKREKKKEMEKARALPSDWLVPKIRVRVVSKSYGSLHYCKKAVVFDVPQPKYGTLHMDSGDTVESVKEKHLETVLPAVGGKCLVLRGSRRGSTGKLLQKDSALGRAAIQLYDDMSVEKLSLDDIAEFLGTLDSDL